MELEIIKYIDERWKVVMTHPMLFVVVFAVGALSGLAWRGQEVANLSGRIEGYKEDLERAKNAPSATVAEESNQPPQPDFTPDEIERLKELLSKSPAYIEIFEGDIASPWSETIRQTFEASGWKVGTFTPGSVFASAEPPVMLRWIDPAATPTITAAFDAAGIPYDLTKSEDGEQLSFWAGAVLGEREPLKKP